MGIVGICTDYDVRFIELVSSYNITALHKNCPLHSNYCAERLIFVQSLILQTTLILIVFILNKLYL